MLAIVNSLALAGMDANAIQVEVDVSPGLPSFDLVGLPDASVRESRERVRTAIRNAGYDFPAKRITVNLAPADLKKEGPGFDLPIAIGILVSTGQLRGDFWQNCFFVGELSLQGELRSIPGILSMAWTLAHYTDKNYSFVVPKENGFEAALVSNLKVISPSNLVELVSLLQDQISFEYLNIDIERYFEEEEDQGFNFKQVRGQSGVKRGLEIAAAGGHNVLLIGPPGSGKTMLAKSLIGIMPPLDIGEALEVSRIYSVAGLLNAEKPLVMKRPFRTPHHTASAASMIGGGRTPKPGEISLANHGVLFLDEMPEFRRDILEALRQPLEDRQVTVTRVRATFEYPANFMLVATANPCPCGYYGDREKECMCTVYQIQKYRNRLSGPLLDRIDLQIEVPRLTLIDLQGDVPGEDSAIIRERVIKARERQYHRLKEHGLYYNAQIKGTLMNKLCKVKDDGIELLHKAFEQLGLSMRAHDRILKIARTIADMEDKDFIHREHIAESLQYRLWDRQPN